MSSAAVLTSAVPGMDFPEDREVVDVIAASRGDAVMSFVEQAADGELVITAPQDRAQRRVRLEVGERMDLVWKGPDELRSLPVELHEVTSGAVPLWRVRPVGPAGRGQRRAAVRAPLMLPVHVAVRGADHLDGMTVDVSEGGMRCILDGLGNADRTNAQRPAANSVPAPREAATDEGTDPDASPAGTEQPTVSVGDVITVRFTVDGGEISTRAEVVRRHHRDDERNEVSVHFLDLPEFTQDLIRRHVFACLREMRLRGAL